MFAIYYKSQSEKSEGIKFLKRQRIQKSIMFLRKMILQFNELFPALANAIKKNMQNSVFKVDQNSYRETLQEAARIEREKYTGMYRLRYNFAQETFVRRFEENVRRSMDYEQAEREALRYTSEKLGHYRKEIMKHYLG